MRTACWFGVLASALYTAFRFVMLAWNVPDARAVLLLSLGTLISFLTALLWPLQSKRKLAAKRRAEWFAQNNLKPGLDATKR